MNSLVLLLVAAALVSLNCSANAYPQQNIKEIDNNLYPYEFPSVSNSRRRSKEQYVKISTPPPKMVRFTPGTDFLLECEAIGNPSPVIRWMKNGETIMDFEEVDNEIYSNSQISYATLISKLVVQSAVNGDVFTCVAMSGVHEASAYTTVYSDEGDSENSAPNTLSPGTPVITAFYDMLLQTIGTSATLPCKIHSPSPSQMYWLDNMNKLVYGNPKIRVLPSGSLHISNLSWEDMGGYRCTVKNMYGQDSVETFLYPLKPSKH